MKILVINAGSSSMKYQLIDMEDESVIAKGNCERIGVDGHFKHTTGDGRVYETDVVMNNHTEAFVQIKNALISEEYGVIKNLDEVSAIGHRIVQGGALFSESVLVNEDVIKGIESLIPLAPLHNAAHVQGIRACLDVFGLSIQQCPRKRLHIPYLMSIMKSMLFVVTVSTELLTDTFQTAVQNSWEKI